MIINSIFFFSMIRKSNYFPHSILLDSVYYILGHGLHLSLQFSFKFFSTHTNKVNSKWQKQTDLVG